MDKEDKVQKYYSSKRGVVDNDKMSIHQGLTVPKLYVINNIASKYMKRKNDQGKGKSKQTHKYGILKILRM